MASGRDKQKDTQKKTLCSHDFLMIDAVIPEDLPKKAKPLSDLIIPPPDAAENLNIPKTAHSVYQTRKVTTHSLIFLKCNDAGSPISDFEVGCELMCRLVATPDYVASVRLYYDANNNYQPVAVGSKALSGFIPNSEAPLVESDLIIDIAGIEIENQRNQLMRNISLLLDKVKRPVYNFQTSYLNFSFSQMAKNLYNNSTFSPLYTAVKFRESLISFQTDLDKFRINKLEAMLATLKGRLNHISDSRYKLNHSEEKLKDFIEGISDESMVLTQAIKNITAILKLKTNDHTKEITIVEMEQLYKKLKALKVNLSKYNEDDMLKLKMDNKKYRIKMKDLKNYGILRGLGTSLITRYIFKEVDNHRNNMSKFGPIIDFDMCKFNILHRFKKSTILDKLFRTPTKTTFIVTERDIRNFPDIKDADLYYWPTKQTKVNQSVLDAIARVFDITKNFFTPHDNEVYKKLAKNPIFIFHKFKTLLKYILTDVNMYRSLLTLHMREKYKDSNGIETNLIEEMVNDERERINEIRMVLIHMQEFRDFLSNHGDFAYHIIRSELSEYKTKYMNKLDTKPYYQNLVDSIDLDLLDRKFDQLYIDASTGKSLINESIPVNTSMRLT